MSDASAIISYLSFSSVIDSAFAARNNNRLSATYDTLYHIYNELARQHQILGRNYNTLHAANARIIADANAMADAYRALTADYNKLQAEHETLRQEHALLAIQLVNAEERVQKAVEVAVHAIFNANPITDNSE